MYYRSSFIALTAFSLALAASTTTVAAQEAGAVPAARPSKPPTIVLGLKKFTKEQVNDMLVTKFGDSEGLESHACGANLMELGFPRTSAIYFSQKDAPAQTVVALVEPGDTSAIRSNVIGTTSEALPADWEAALKPFIDSVKSKKDSTVMRKYLQSNQFNSTIRLYQLVARSQLDSAKMFAPKAKLTEEQMKLWDFLAANKSPEAKARALNILANDSSSNHRALATAVLTNFSSTDDTWHAVLHLLRDPSQNVNGVASNVLMAMAGMEKRKIDWAPAAVDIRAILGGAELWYLPNLMNLLAATKIDPSLAKTVLGNNSTYVWGYATIDNVPAAHMPARRLLYQLSGQDYSKDPNQWKTWIDSL